MEGFPFCCGRCGEGRGVWLLTENEHRIKLEKKWKVILMIFFFKYIVFVLLGFKDRDPEFLIWTNFSCFCSEFINWDWFEKFASKSAFGENFSFKYWHQVTNGVISYLLFSFLSLGRRFLAYDGEEEDKDVYLLLSPPVDNHDGDNGWLIAIGDVDDDRITPIVITGQRQRIAFTWSIKSPDRDGDDWIGDWQW